MYTICYTTNILFLEKTICSKKIWLSDRYDKSKGIFIRIQDILTWKVFIFLRILDILGNIFVCSIRQHKLVKDDIKNSTSGKWEILQA